MATVLLRILTANLYNGIADADDFGDLLDQTRPDVVACQELGPSAAAVIAQRMPHGILLPALDHTGMALASIQPIEVHRHSLPHRDGLVGRLRLEDRPLTIWSVHLANPLDLPPTLKRRRAQALALSEAVAAGQADGDRIVVVGDLNATPIWPVYRLLRRHLADGVADWAAREGTRAPRTWAYRSGMRPLLRIDHALVSGVVVKTAESLLVPGSDHRALVVDVEGA